MEVSDAKALLLVRWTPALVACSVLAATIPQTAPVRLISVGIAWKFRDVVNHGQTVCGGEHRWTVMRGREMTGGCKHSAPVKVIP